MIDTSKLTIRIQALNDTYREIGTYIDVALEDVASYPQLTESSGVGLFSVDCSNVSLKIYKKSTYKNFLSAQRNYKFVLKHENILMFEGIFDSIKEEERYLSFSVFGMMKAVDNIYSSINLKYDGVSKLSEILAGTIWNNYLIDFAPNGKNISTELAGIPTIQNDRLNFDFTKTSLISILKEFAKIYNAKFGIAQGTFYFVSLKANPTTKTLTGIYDDFNKTTDKSISEITLSDSFIGLSSGVRTTDTIAFYNDLQLSNLTKTKVKLDSEQSIRLMDYTQYGWVTKIKKDLFMINDMKELECVK